jgi:hypothetical protein
VPATGPANVHAQSGLCTAFLAANPGTRTSTSSAMPPQDSSTAFQALLSQHGGVAATTTYCKGVAHPATPSSTVNPPARGVDSENGDASDAAKPSMRTQPTPAGNLSPASKPPGIAKPSSAGASDGHAPVSTPNSGGTNTANTASGGHSATGTATANSASRGASSAGSANAAPAGR